MLAPLLIRFSMQVEAEQVPDITDRYGVTIVPYFLVTKVRVLYYVQKDHCLLKERMLSFQGFDKPALIKRPMLNTSQGMCYGVCMRIAPMLS